MKKQLIFDGVVYDLVPVQVEPEPEWKPRKGELCEFWTYTSMSPELAYFIHCAKNDEYVTSRGVFTHCRPIQDPDLIQMIPWEGGECPVPKDAVVLALLYNRKFIVKIAADFIWTFSDLGSDIVKYAVLK